MLRRVQLARSILRCLRWRGSAWSPDFQELYFNSLDCPYAEVRALIGSVINGLDQLEWNASFPSAKVLVDTVLKDTNHEVDIMGVMHPPFEARLKETIANLQELRKVRPHGPTAAMSSHDNTALTSECDRAGAMRKR